MGRGGVRVSGSALTADVRVGRQAVAEQLHVPSRGIHASLGAQLPCQSARSVRSDPSPSLEPTVSPLPPRGSSAPWKGSPSQVPPRRERLPNFLADLGPGWEGVIVLPRAQAPQQPKGPGSEPQEAPPPSGVPKRSLLLPSGKRDGGGRRGRLPTPWAGSGKGSRLSLPSRPPRGDPSARRPGLTHRQRPASLLPGPGASSGRRHPGPGRSRPVRSRPPARLSARLGSQAAAARAGLGLMDRPAESFLRGKRRDGAGRGGGGGEEKGRERKGRGG